MGAAQHFIFIKSFQTLICIPDNGHRRRYRTARKEITPMLSHLIRLFRAWRRYEASLRELSRLGDRELADIGVARSEISRIAWETARR
jgi:uncharacterized protein YjiS (DUF1127 family)